MIFSCFLNNVKGLALSDIRSANVHRRLQRSLCPLQSELSASRPLHHSFSYIRAVMLSDILASRVAQAYASNEYPVLLNQFEVWKNTRPLAGLRILDATPVFENTLAKHAVLLAAGAELTVGIDDVMPRNNEVVRYLRSVGIPVVEPKEVKTSRAFDLVLDCAAAFAKLKPRIGFVELTRSGVSKYADKSCPVYVADSGRIKRIETCLGTGESYFRAMAQLGYSQWQGKSIVIFGSGKVGSGLITYAHRYGCRITVVTRPGDITDRIRVLCDAVIDASDGIAIAEAVSQANAVVTATGVPSAATAACPADVFIRSKALLANMGVEDEFGAGVPAGRVLEAKRPLNFILKDPTLMKYIDATMALHNEGAVVLASKKMPAGLIEPDASTEERLLSICREKGTISDELNYI